MLRFYSGLSIPEVAEHMASRLGRLYFIVERMWTHARAWLSRELFGLGTR